MVARDDLQDLVDHPAETLNVEHKQWLDLSDKGVRADIARHLAALANHGGGAIVFGFTDDMKVAGTNPFAAVDRDVIASIVTKYLEPPFHCDVHSLTTATGNVHPVVVVPPHGVTPICAKASGPHDTNNKPIGIVQGAYYIRKPGPSSAAISSSSEWAPVIRRCVMHDRSGLLGALDATLRGPGEAGKATSETLKAWHDAAHAAFLAQTAKRADLKQLIKAHVQLSYAIEHGKHDTLNPNGLIEVLREARNEVREMAGDGGWSLFRQLSGSNEPQFRTDKDSGLGETDFLESSVQKDAARVTHYDLWRFSTDGLATIIRGYAEDDPGQVGFVGGEIGTWLSPNWAVWMVAELVRHARAISERFPTSTAVSFRCTWQGIAGRKPHDTRGRWSDYYPPAAENAVTGSGSWPVGMLNEGWPEIVEKLVGPVARQLGVGHVLVAPWIAGQAPTWLRA